MKISHLYFSIFCGFGAIAANSNQSPAIVPTLTPECKFSEFQTQKMPGEREKFWARTSTQETHDLAGELNYNEKLVQQIQTCYLMASARTLIECDFSKVDLFDIEKITPTAASSEYYYWGISPLQGQDQVYPAKINYMQMLSRKLESCFTWENIQEMNPHSFSATLAAVQALNRNGGEPGTSTEVKDTSSHRSCRDCDNWESLSYKGITVRHENGKLTVEETVQVDGSIGELNHIYRLDRL